MSKVAERQEPLLDSNGNNPANNQSEYEPPLDIVEHPVEDSENNGLVEGESPTKNWANRTFAPMGPGSIRGSYFTLLSTAYGAVILTMPYLMSLAGIVVGWAIIITAGLINLWSLHVLSKVSLRTGATQFSDAVVKTLGKKWSRGLSMNLIGFCYGTVVSYYITLNQFLISFLNSVGVIDDETQQGWLTPSDPRYWHTYMIIAAVALLGYPIAARREISSLRFISLFGCSVVIYVFLVIVAETPDLIHYWPKNEDIKWAVFDWNTIVAWSIGIYSYTMQTNFFPVREELQRPNLGRLQRISNRVLTSLICTYVIVSVTGYLSCPVNTPQIFIDRPEKVGWDDLPMTIGKGLMVTNIFVNVPLNLNPCRLEILILLGKDKNTNKFLYHGITIAISASCAIFAMLIPNVATALGVMGGICSTSLCATFPSFMYLKVTKLSEERWKYRFTQFMGVFLTLMGFFAATVIILQAAGVVG